MTFLAPWALAIGALAAAGAVLLHLVARQRPAAYLLPTTRFIPDRRTLVSRIATRPRDLLLLALRVLLLLSVSAAFARPVFEAGHEPLGRLILLDRSTAVADPAAALERARALVATAGPSRLITFGDSAVLGENAAATLDSLARDTSRASVRGGLTAALVAAGRAAPDLAALADSVELVIVSPLVAAELDAATDSVRALWPGRISLARVPARTDSATRWTLERALAPDHPLAPALATIGVSATSKAVRLVDATATAADSAFARAGGTVVRWVPADGPFAPTALAVGDDVVVALLSRVPIGDGGRVRARWSDGTPAALETPLGEGCVRNVAVGVPIVGDLPLRPTFRRAVRGLVAPCGTAAVSALADSAAVSRLIGAPRLATASALRAHGDQRSPLVPWLLGLAFACALTELFVRSRREPEPA
jgi:hypothetical protein